jgi:hypothetical protein
MTLRSLLVLYMVMALCWEALAGEQRLAFGNADYSRFVEAYHGGNFTGSVALLLRWPDDTVRNAVRDAARAATDASAQGRGFPPSLLMSAVMLHTEAGTILAATNPNRTEFHLDMARSLLKALPAEASRFRERWSAHSLDVYLLARDYRRARLALNVALTDFPKSVELMTYVGVLMELEAGTMTPDLRGYHDRPAVSSAGAFDRKLNEATAAVNRAVLADGDYLPARLRLGWLNLVNNSVARAREQIVLVRERTTDPELRYLAHLFLGALEERQGRPDAAYQEFASAHGALPEAQSAVIACLRTARTSGRLEVIPRLLAEYSRPRKQAPADPWWYFTMGVTGSERLMWLRRQATGT